MVVRQTQRKISAKRSHQCTRLRQPQRSIGQTGTPLAFNQQRCEVRIQPPHPSVMCQINSRSLNGSYEYHCAKHDQRNWSNHPKRSTHPQSKLEMELRNVRQQQSQKELLQACRFGFYIRRIINWAVAPCNQDQLQVHISARPSQR